MNMLDVEHFVLLAGYCCTRQGVNVQVDMIYDDLLIPVPLADYQTGSKCTDRHDRLTCLFHWQTTREGVNVHVDINEVTCLFHWQIIGQGVNVQVDMIDDDLLVPLADYQTGSKCTGGHD